MFLIPLDAFVVSVTQRHLSRAFDGGEVTQHDAVNSLYLIGSALELPSLVALASQPPRFLSPIIGASSALIGDGAAGKSSKNRRASGKRLLPLAKVRRPVEAVSNSHTTPGAF